MPADMNDYFKKKPTPKTPGGEPPNGPRLNNQSGGSTPQGKLIPWVITIAIIGFAFVTFKPFAIINSGEVGIKVRMGVFDSVPLEPGLHFYIPIFEKILPVNTRIRLITYSNTETTAAGDNYIREINSENFEGGLKRNPAIEVKDIRGLKVNMDIAVQYSIKPSSSPKTIAMWGTGWEEKIINSKVREVVRDVIGQYTAEQLPQMRKEIAAAIEKKISDRMNSLEGKPVILSSVELRNIELPVEINKQIERVQIAKQQITIAEQQKLQAKQEAEKKAEIAKGEAQRNRIEAQGEADKIRIEAEEQAKANKLISDSLTPNLIELEKVKTQAKFNEALKVNTNAQIFLTPGGAVPNIWVDAKGGTGGNKALSETISSRVEQ